MYNELQNVSTNIFLDKPWVNNSNRDNENRTIKAILSSHLSTIKCLRFYEPNHLQFTTKGGVLDKNVNTRKRKIKLDPHTTGQSERSLMEINVKTVLSKYHVAIN